MKHLKPLFILIVTTLFFTNCQNLEPQLGTQISDASALQEAINNAEPGAELVMANGIWKDIQIKFYGNGTEAKPITLRAETPGEVFIEGQSDLKLGGEHLIVDGLYFRNGASPSRSVIQFYLNKDTLAHHSQVTNCVIKDFNKAQKNKSDLWVAFKGRHNQLDHCYLAGKTNKGPTIRVDIAGNESIKNYHKINNNHFGRRPPKGGPSAETIQIGDSFTSMSPSYTSVSDNLFDRCDGEVEVISSKTNFNEFRNNVFYKSEGSLVTRHGNYCTVDGNYFIGDEASSNAGGIRLIGTGHWVTNNYFYKLKGEIFRAPIAVMNGIRKSPLNRYIQVTDVVVAHNTWVDCTSPWQFGVGSNIDQKDVLPASEIRSETPIRTIVANNLIYNSKGDPMPIFRHDSIDGIDFKSNVINNSGMSFRGLKGLEEKQFSMTELEENIWVPSLGDMDIEAFKGFGFDEIKTDLFGNSRDEKSSIGATNGAMAKMSSIMDPSKYGPKWFDPKPAETNPKTLAVANVQELQKVLVDANDGDIIELTGTQYDIKSPLKINKKISIRSGNPSNKSILKYSGKAGTPAFEMHPYGELIMKSIILQGSNNNYAFSCLEKNMSNHYGLNVIDSEISNFDYVLKAYKHSFAEYIKFNSTLVKNCNNGLELSSEDDARGEYNVENLFIRECRFEGVQKNVIDYYRGGYDESTVGGNLIVDGCTFSNSGASEKSGVLIKTHGILNVNITNSTFLNNRVKMVARLWGAKNNSESDNTFKNSGRIVTEQNLPQKLMY